MTVASVSVEQVQFLSKPVMKPSTLSLEAHTSGTFVIKRSAHKDTNKIPAVITTAPSIPNVPVKVAALPLMRRKSTSPGCGFRRLGKGFP
ncbi:hypothetical protein N5P37_006501 [Trichoderma harzianum]|nr:hypothetical protein N5P37_006501 [Trichoderma harzianum]